ncbi:MAG: polysaccharide deacetylase family protein [Xanthobacteraceae bacterium]
MIRSFLKRAFPVVACGTGLNRAAAVRYSGRGVIFMLHSVSDEERLHTYCSVSKLAQILGWLRRQGVALVTVDDAVERLKVPSGAPFAAFTFDDGYADTLTHALPVMERFQAPFTLYVTTAMITGDLDAWWLGLAALFAEREEVRSSHFGWRFRCPDFAAKKRAILKIESLVRGSYDVLPYIRELILENGIDSKALVAREGLNAGDLRKLAAHPLVTIGAHSTGHENLARESAATVLREMTESRRFLESTTGSPVVHFAYPFGDKNACGEREAGLAREAGFRTAVTTRRGTLFPKHLEHLFALPREPLSGEDTRYSLRCKLDGVYRAVYSNWSDPVAHM